MKNDHVILHDEIQPIENDIRDILGAENFSIIIKIDVKKNLTTNNFYNKLNKKNTLHYRTYQRLFDNVFFLMINYLNKNPLHFKVI